MKYRVRLDLPFENETNARALLTYANKMLTKATSVKDEVAFCELELCGHDEGLPCKILERLEV